MNDLLTNFAAYVKGASLLTDKAMTALQNQAAATKQAADQAAGLPEAWTQAGLLPATEQATCRELLATHAGAVQLAKWACEQLAVARQQLAEGLAKQAALDTGRPVPDTTPAPVNPKTPIDYQKAAADLLAMINDDPR